MDRDGKTSAVPYALMVFLWGSVAAWLHFGLAMGGYEVGVVHEDHKALETFAEIVGDKVDARQKPVEIALEDSNTQAPPVPTAPPPTPTEKPQVKPPPTVTPRTPEPKKVVPKPLPEKKVVALAKPEPSAKVAPPPPMHSDKRIAVRQHVKPDQAANPDAHFIGDQANHVDHETVATLTSHDRDDENPTPSGAHQNPDRSPGDSTQQKIADSDEHKGDDHRAPGERGTEFDIQHDPPPDRPMGPVAMIAPNPAQVTPSSGGDGRPQGNPSEQQPPPELAPGNTAPPSPDVRSSDSGNWSFNIARVPGTGEQQRTGPGSASRTLAPPVVGPRVYGLGGRAQPGQVNLNMNNHGVVAVVGRDELHREREADGARRKSEHRGSWQASNFQRWRSAIENYVTSVKPGNQTALNTAGVPFATYLNGMHNRIHPIFADSFLLSLDSLPPTNALNDQRLITRLEIVLSKDGHLVRMGVVKTSGVTAFDIAALDSVERASPFGPAPQAIVSPDGRVYLHWEFHRDEVYACSTMNARPFLLNVSPAPPPTERGPVTPTPGGTPRERGAPPPGIGDSREGLLLLRPPHDG